MAERNPKRIKLQIPSHDLPDDIMFSILSRSSVKALLRFTTASKSWNNLIRSPTFVAAHHHGQIHNEKYKIDCYLFFMPEDDRKPWQFLSMLREVYVSSGISCPMYSQNVAVYNLALPFRQYDLAGTCEGLICLTKDSDVYIWNPHVGSMKILPPSRSSAKRRSTKAMTVAFGIGLVEKSCDYKVVKLIFYKGLFINMEIYSSATDSWKRIDENSWAGERYWKEFYSEGYYGGSIYWMGLSKKDNLSSKIVNFKFNLEEEIFEESLEIYANRIYLETGNVRAQKDYRFPIRYYTIRLRESLFLLDKKHNYTRIDMTSFKKFN